MNLGVEQKATLEQAISVRDKCQKIVSEIRKRTGMPPNEVRMEEVILKSPQIQATKDLDPAIKRYFEALSSLAGDEIRWRNSNPSLRLLVVGGSGGIWLGMDAYKVGPLGLILYSNIHEVFNGNRIQTEVLPIHFESVERSLAAKLQETYDGLKKHIGTVEPFLFANNLLEFVRTYS